MPLEPGSRNIVAGGASPYIPLITNNPAFKVAIIPMDGALEQKPRQKSGRAEIEKVKIGDIVRGEEVSGTRKRGKQVLGRVLQVNLQDGGIVSYKIITQRGKEVLLDPSTVTKIDVNGEDPSPMSAPQTQLESYEPVERVLLYEQWKSNQ
jgi:hypothetical protein